MSELSTSSNVGDDDQQQLPKKLPKKLPTSSSSSAAAAASASSGARVTDDLSMSTQMQLKRDLAAASISSSSNSIYASGSAPASWREYYRSCGWFNSCISAGAAAPAAAMLATEVHVTETASEASLHAIAEAVAEFAIGD